MKRRTFLKNTGAASLLTLITPAGIVEIFNQKREVGLENSFINPPASAKPHTWWHWMNGNVTKEGITLDLEAMQRIGIGGFQNFDAGTGIPEGPIKYLSPEWLELKKHAIKEADRLGLEFTMHNCPGWSSSGGPWITPELSMLQLSWSEAFVKGGKRVKMVLSKPFSNLDYYQDVAILAYPSLKGEVPLKDLLRSATSNSGAINIAQLTGEDPQGVSIQPANGEQKCFLQFELKEPFEASSFMSLASPTKSTGFGNSGSLVLEVSDDGKQFREVASINQGAQLGASAKEVFLLAEFVPVKAKYFRLTSPEARHFSAIQLSGFSRLDDWKKKANYEFTGEGVNDSPGYAEKFSSGSIIDQNSLVDITQHMDEDGMLNWKAPAGSWTILRIGFTSMGTLNRSAPDTGVGLECDKFSAEAITFHFNKMMEALLPFLSPLTSRSKVGLLIDSYEVGMQNWTPKFEEQFKKRMGYNLLTYLPAMTGRVVGSVEMTNRFLWDLRRSQADLMSDNYYGKFTELCHQHGILSYTQPYDRGPMDEMQIGSRVDTNVGEFWNNLSSIFQNNWTMRRTLKLSASIAHVNGQKVVGAESFTGEPESAKWQEYPFAMKVLGDKKFTEGLNRIIFHRFAHQPHPTAKPGMTMGPWGIHFDRTNTWWEQGKAWMEYLTRCQSLLQQGLFVADLAYFTGELPGGYTKIERNELTPPPPKGYDYDVMNPEVIMKRVRIVNGRITLPDGMSYGMMVLQEPKGISLSLLRKLQDLVREGMVLFGPKPSFTLGLKGYPEDRAVFESIIAQLWGADARESGEHTFGKGRVYWGKPLPEVLNALSLKPDFLVSSQSGDAPINCIHRRIENAEIYFVANQRRSQEELVCTFRVTEMQPELWDPSTGKLTPVGIYEQIGDQVRVPIQIPPFGSVFVVFRSPAAKRYVQAVFRGDNVLLGAKPFLEKPRQLHKDVAGTFTLSVWAKPEFNVMLNTSNFMGNIADPWTDYYAIYPPCGTNLYEEGHATVGLTIGRNGVAVWEHGNKPVMVLAAPTAISGWSHVALVYHNGAPSVYVNGKLIEQGKVSGNLIHPGIGQANLDEGASYYNGDISTPELFKEALSEGRLQQLVSKGAQLKPVLPVVEVFGDSTPELLFWQNGRFTLRNNMGRTATLQVTGLGDPQEINGTWQVDFPPNLGAPNSITLPKLISLHKHAQNGVRYFSGTATYRKVFNVQANTISAIKGRNQRLFLDLGRVEVLAQVLVNGKDLGIHWKRPYLVDVTDVVHTGRNSLEVRVTNLWPNRLIGDEQFPDEYSYTKGSKTSSFASLSVGAIEKLPEWYMQGKPKPESPRVAFTTWKHYEKDSPLLESGLVGPVLLRTAFQHTLVDYLSNS